MENKLENNLNDEIIKSNSIINTNNIKLMKKGDYTVHVLIEEIKNLKVDKIDYLPKPMIKVTCFGVTKRASKPPHDCEAYTFNEHLYFDSTDLSVDILDSSKILIEVYDYHNFKRENYFGIQEFDFEYIYSQKDHCIKNIWIALANPESKDITKINGYLKLSISILSTEDEKIELVPDINSDSNCLLPPQIKITYKQLEIYIFKGEHFPDMENTFGKERTSNKRFEGFMRSTKKSPSAVELKKEAEEANEVKNQQKAFLMQGFKDKKLKSKKLIKQAQAYTNTKKEEN